MKKLSLLLVLISLLLTACTFKPLAKLSIPEDEELTIDVRDEFDPNSIITDVKEGSEVSYELDEVNSKIIITIKNKDKEETLEKTVNIQYPLGEFKEENITIDTYTGYDINDLVKVSEETTITEELDEENGILKVTLTNGDRTETIEKDVEVVNSNPFPVHWNCYCPNDPYYYNDYYINEDGTFYETTTLPSTGPWNGIWTGDLKHGTIGGETDSRCTYPMYEYNLQDDGTIRIESSPFRDGRSGHYVCKIVNE